MSKKKVFFLLCLVILSALLFACDTASGGDTQKETPHTHVFGEWKTEKEATCSTEGLMSRKCEECGKTEERKLQTVAHSLTMSVIAPTCESQGYTAYVCKCGYSHLSDYTEPLGHKFKETVYPPDCTEQGHTHYACELCDYEFDSDFVKPTGHTLSSEVTAPTCTDEGYTAYSCDVCDYGFNSDFVKPLGHRYTEQRVYPTATKSGYTTFTCECKHTYTVEVFYSDIMTSSGEQVLYKGIDVSKWNHQMQGNTYLPLDWNAIKAAGIDFVIIKVGGKNGIEPTFEMDYEGARAAGLKVGAYIYTYSTTVAGALTDAENVLEWIKGKQFEYPIYLDMEDSSQESLDKDLLSDMCLAFIEKLQENGYYAALYTNYNWLTYIYDTDTILSLFDIWYARYSGTGDPAWDEESYGKPLGMWQYTDSGTIEGCPGSFDMNYAYKDYEKLMKEWKLNGF